MRRARLTCHGSREHAPSQRGSSCCALLLPAPSAQVRTLDAAARVVLDGPLFSKVSKDNCSWSIVVRFSLPPGEPCHGQANQAAPQSCGGRYRSLITPLIAHSSLITPAVCGAPRPPPQQEKDKRILVVTLAKMEHLKVWGAVMAAEAAGEAAHGHSHAHHSHSHA